MNIHRFLATGAALAAAAFLPAPLQAQGTFTTFGSGCAGYCDSANPGTTANSSLTQNSNIFALGVNASSSLRVVTGFEFFTQSLGSGPLTIATQIYGADTAGAPTGSPLATGTMVLGTAQNWYRTTFATPLIVPANTKIFLSYTSVASAMKFPIASTGTKVSHFWHSATATAWNGTPPNGFLTQSWAWKLICSPGPSLSNTGVPTLGSSLTVDLSGASAGAKAIFALGASNTAWGGVSLPLDLSALNALCCKLYVSLDYQFLVKADGSGNYSFGLKVPNDTKLKGLKFYTQYAVDAPGANGFGVLFTQAGEGTIN